MIATARRVLTVSAVLALFCATRLNAAELTPAPVFNRAPLAEKPYAELPLGSIQPEGWLRDELRRMAEGMTGHLDQWYTEICGPRMVMLKILQQYYLASGDQRVIDCLTSYFRYQLAELPRRPLHDPSNPNSGSWWAAQRGGDNLMVVLWLYEVFDLISDPNETTGVANPPAETLAKLKARLAEFTAMSATGGRSVATAIQAPDAAFVTRSGRHLNT